MSQDIIIILFNAHATSMEITVRTHMGKISKSYDIIKPWITVHVKCIDDNEYNCGEYVCNFCGHRHIFMCKNIWVCQGKWYCFSVGVSGAFESEIIVEYWFF